ncbi:MAG: DUF5679 domain-containing protein [Patescibacteria group bacterium]
MVKMYCVKCRESKEVADENVKPVTMKNGKPASEATCPTCSTRMFRIGATKAA